MKKSLGFALFCVSLSLFANSPWEEEEVASLQNTYDKPTLVEISNELVRLAGEEEAQGEWELARMHLLRALRIRESLGLRVGKAYASLLLLTSSVSYQAGNSCEAKSFALEAESTFHKLGLAHFATKAKNDGVAYSKMCPVLALK